MSYKEVYAQVKTLEKLFDELDKAAANCTAVTKQMTNGDVEMDEKKWAKLTRTYHESKVAITKLERSATECQEKLKRTLADRGTTGTRVAAKRFKGVEIPTVVPTGRQVAARISKEREVPEEWILASVVRWIAEENRYEVEDEDPGDETDPNPVRRHYRVTAAGVIPLPENPEKNEFSKSTEVLAMFPATTSFYRAFVIAPPKSRKHPEYTLKFVDDDDESGETPARRVNPKYVVTKAGAASGTLWHQLSLSPLLRLWEERRLGELEDELKTFASPYPQEELISPIHVWFQGCIAFERGQLIEAAQCFETALKELPFSSVVLQTAGLQANQLLASVGALGTSGKELRSLAQESGKEGGWVWWAAGLSAAQSHNFSEVLQLTSEGLQLLCGPFPEGEVSLPSVPTAQREVEGLVLLHAAALLASRDPPKAAVRRIERLLRALPTAPTDLSSQGNDEPSCDPSGPLPVSIVTAVLGGVAGWWLRGPMGALEWWDGRHFYSRHSLITRLRGYAFLGMGHIPGIREAWAGESWEGVGGVSDLLSGNRWAALRRWGGRAHASVPLGRLRSAVYNAAALWGDLGAPGPSTSALKLLLTPPSQGNSQDPPRVPLPPVSQKCGSFYITAGKPVGSGEVWERLGMGALQARDWETARSALWELWAPGKRWEGVHTPLRTFRALLWATLFSGRGREAQRLSSQLLAWEPWDSCGTTVLALSHVITGHPLESLPLFLSALQSLSPNHVGVLGSALGVLWSHVAVGRVMSGQLSEALVAAQRAVESLQGTAGNSHVHLHAWFTYVLVLFKLKRFLEGCQLWRQFREQTKNSSEGLTENSAMEVDVTVGMGERSDLTRGEEKVERRKQWLGRVSDSQVKVLDRVAEQLLQQTSSTNTFTTLAAQFSSE